MTKSRFGNLKSVPAPAAAEAAPAAADTASKSTSAKAKAREGKVSVMGYYSPEVRRTLHQMALDEDTSIQALLGEAIDLLMRAKGKHPFGER